MALLPKPSGIDEYLQGYDPVSARKAAGLFARLARYHRLEVRGLDHIPPGAALLVGNHNGGFSPVDGLFLVPYYERHGFDDPVHVLAHDILFRPPGMGRWLARFGIIPASPGNGGVVLERGH